MARLDSFATIYERLRARIPTIIAIRGQCQDSSFNRRRTHFLAIVGYDAKKDKILCIDSTGQNDANTLVAIDREELLMQWCVRGQIALLFNNP